VGQRQHVHEWLDHTSELELRVRADSVEGVVADATAALAEVLGEPETHSRGPVARELSVTAADPAGLLAAWLEEIVFLAEHEGLVAERAQGLELASDALHGEVVARPGRAAHLVKAVTYHRLALEQDERGWWGRAVLDV
jgi:SHS2 domain-containing protein